MTRPDNEHVFKNDEYLYGVRARVNAGYGLWQLAFGSKADLTAANYAAARAAMMDFRADGERVLGVRPTTLVVPPSLEDRSGSGRCVFSTPKRIAAAAPTHGRAPPS